MYLDSPLFDALLAISLIAMLALIRDERLETMRRGGILTVLAFVLMRMVWFWQPRFTEMYGAFGADYPAVTDLAISQPFVGILSALSLSLVGVSLWPGLGEKRQHDCLGVGVCIGVIGLVFLAWAYHLPMVILANP